MKFVLTLLLALVLNSASSQRTGILFSSLSETGTATTGWDGFQRCANQRLVYSTFVKRYGTQSTRFQSRLQDTATCTKVLSHLILNDTDLLKYERWYGFSVYFSTGYPDNYEGDDTFLEFMRNGTDTMPPLVLSYHGKANGTGYYPTGQYLTVIRNSTVPDTPMIYINPLWAIQRNAWNDFVIYIKWANDSTGRIRIWLNGRYVYGYNGRNNYTSNNLRLGSDFWNWSKRWGMPTTVNTRELFVDEFRVGNYLSSYLDVLPDSNDPPPNPTSANQFYQVVDNKINNQLISFKIQQDTNWRSNWELRDANTGRRMMSGSFLIFKGYRTYNLNLPFTVPSGQYLFLVTTNRFNHVRKLTKS